MIEHSSQLPGRLTTISVLLMAAMTIMANATIAPSLPGLKAHFSHVEGIDTLAGLVLTLPSLSVLLTAGLWGWMADRLDRQKLLAVSALAYGIGGASGLFAETLPQLLLGRALLGIGVAGTMTLAMAWAADLWQGPARARFMGLQGASMSFGGIVVMVGGGALALAHWRGAFGVYLLALPIAMLALAQLAPHARRLRAGAAERRAVHAAAPAEPFPWAIFAFVGALSFLFMAVFYVMPTRMPFLLEERGVSNTLVVGAAMAAMMLASLPGALLYGYIRRYVSAMAVFAGCFLVMGAGMLVISLAEGLGGTVLGILIMGMGMGPSMPNFSTYFMAHVPPSQRGRASGLMTTAFFAGQFAAPVVSAPLVSAFGLSGAFEALAAALAAIGVILTVAALREKQAGALDQPFH